MSVRSCHIKFCLTARVPPPSGNAVWLSSTIQVQIISLGNYPELAFKQCSMLTFSMDGHIHGHPPLGIHVQQQQQQ